MERSQAERPAHDLDDPGRAEIVRDFWGAETLPSEPGAGDCARLRFRPSSGDPA